MTRGPELGTVDDHSWKALVRRKQLRQHRPRGREQELVDVEERDPAGVVTVDPDAMLEGLDHCLRPSFSPMNGMATHGGSQRPPRDRAPGHRDGRPCSRCRTARNAPRRPAGGTRSTRPSSRRRHGISCTLQDRLFGAPRTRPHLMESRDVFTQGELEEMLAQPDLIPICAGTGDLSVGRDDFVRVADSARVYASDGASVEARRSEYRGARPRSRTSPRQGHDRLRRLRRRDRRLPCLRAGAGSIVADGWRTRDRGS